MPLRTTIPFPVFAVLLATSSVACGEDDGAPYVQGDAQLASAQREARASSGAPPGGSSVASTREEERRVSPLGPEADSSGQSSTEPRVEPPRMQLPQRQ